MSTQRIWRIAHSEASLGWGGQEHRVLAELIGFKERGHRVMLYTPKEARLFERARQAEIPVELMGFGRFNFPFTIIRASLWLKRNCVQILNTHSSRDGWAMGIAGRLARVPLLIRSRHFDVPFANKYVSRCAFLNLADHIITTSQATNLRLNTNLGIPNEQITEISTGIEVDRFTPEGLPAAMPLGVTDGVPIIGIVGVVRQAKGHLILLEAAKQLKQKGFVAHYWIIGDGPSMNRVEKSIKELKLERDVSLAGFRNDIPAIMRRLDLLVIPSLHECVPQVGLQALASKTPVVGSDVGGIPEIILNGVTGRIVAPGDANQLADAIVETFTNQEASSRMAARGRELVEREHGLDHMLDRLEEIYRRHLVSSGEAAQS